MYPIYWKYILNNDSLLNIEQIYFQREKRNKPIESKRLLEDLASYLSKSINQQDQSNMRHRSHQQEIPPKLRHHKNSKEKPPSQSEHPRVNNIIPEEDLNVNNNSKIRLINSTINHLNQTTKQDQTINHLNHSFFITNSSAANNVSSPSLPSNSTSSIIRLDDIDYYVMNIEDNKTEQGDNSSELPGRPWLDLKKDVSIFIGRPNFRQIHFGPIHFVQS